MSHPEIAPIHSQRDEPSRGLIAQSRLLDLGVADRFDELVGREEERRLLTEAWNDGGTRILVFVAGGGVGKTSLIVDWTMGFVRDGWAEVEAFFDWSFYSQGTQDQTAANSGLFFDAALRHFGEVELADSPASADVKADRLAECIARRRTLLLLDGVEPLQHPERPAQLTGRFKDTGLERLLKRLAQMPTLPTRSASKAFLADASGLCVVTTRVPVVDLKRFHGVTVREHDLDNLSELAAAKLLHQAGARRAGEKPIAPDDRELRAAARELHGHALAVQLLGGYLKQAQEGDIRRRDRVDWPRAFDQQQEGHAWAVMQAYERWFEQQGAAGGRQLAALRLLGFFDRPASADCLRALRGGPVIVGLTEPLAELSDEDWSTTLMALANEHRLISLVRRGEIEEVDSHPLVREYFAAQLRGARFQRAGEQGGGARFQRAGETGIEETGTLETCPTAWTEGHARLFEHLCTTTEHRPDTLDGLQPLYQAVAHGCQAGLYERARAEVYRDRILRGTGNDGFYSSNKLGAIGLDLGAVACFFERPWSKLSPQLSAGDQAWLLNETATRLRALGRLTEAVEPMRASMVMDVDKEEWNGAAISASNLSELELTLGEVSSAVTSGEQSVAFADRSGDAFERMGTRTTHADALHHAGQRDAARERFAEAERLRAERQPEFPRLYSLWGFRYCDLLLSDAERAAWQFAANPKSEISNLKSLQSDCDAVGERATGAKRAWREIFTNEPSLLDIALDHLTLGRAAMYRTVLSGSENQKSQIENALDAAVHGLRQSGEMIWICRGLLSRAWCRFLLGDRAGCEADLAEAQDIAERGAMPLFLADVHLTRARLFHDRAELARAATLLAQLHTTGYHRRDEQLADAQAAFAT